MLEIHHSGWEPSYTLLLPIPTTSTHTHTHQHNLTPFCPRKLNVTEKYTSSMQKLQHSKSEAHLQKQTTKTIKMKWNKIKRKCQRNTIYHLALMKQATDTKIIWPKSYLIWIALYLAKTSQCVVIKTIHKQHACGCACLIYLCVELGKCKEEKPFVKIGPK